MRQQTVARALNAYHALRAEGASEKRAYHNALEQLIHESAMSREACDALLAREISASDTADWKGEEDD